MYLFLMFCRQQCSLQIELNSFKNLTRADYPGKKYFQSITASGKILATTRVLYGLHVSYSLLDEDVL